jgi:hypothetical protein
MSNSTFSELLKRSFQLYKQEKYSQALNLVVREFTNFPEQAHRLYFWRACLASLTGKTEQALARLEEAVEAGYWYNQQQLREDSDLDSLQGLPRFEGLVETCLERQVVAQAAATPTLITLEPEGASGFAGPPWPLLLTLHGNNNTAEAAAADWGAATSLGWLVALPGSSQVTGPGAYSCLTERYEIDRERVVLGGFSMGGGLAVWLALSGVVQAQGFVVVGPYVPDMDQLLASRGERQASLRGYIIVGEEDDACYEIALALAENLNEQGLRCELVVYPALAHEHPPDFETSLARALDYIFD